MELTIPDIPARLQTVVTTAENDDQANNNGQPSTTQSINGDTYTVQAGDSLWSISVRAYSDGYQWTKLYQANQDQIGLNPDRIEKGVELIIPRD